MAARGQLVPRLQRLHFRLELLTCGHGLLRGGGGGGGLVGLHGEHVEGRLQLLVQLREQCVLGPHDGVRLAQPPGDRAHEGLCLLLARGALLKDELELEILRAQLEVGRLHFLLEHRQLHLVGLGVGLRVGARVGIGLRVGAGVRVGLGSGLGLVPGLVSLF